MLPTCIYIHTHAYIHPCRIEPDLASGLAIYTYIHRRIHIHIHTYTYIHTQTHTRAGSSPLSRAALPYIHTYVHIHTYTYIHTHMRTGSYHIYIHTCTYIHIYTQKHAYRIEPALPLGLTIDLLTGNISGTPQKESERRPYTITASNPVGQTSCTIHARIARSPYDYVYESPEAVLRCGQDMGVNVCACKGTPPVYYKADYLPSGVSVDVYTGELKGIPEKVCAYVCVCMYMYMYLLYVHVHELSLSLYIYIHTHKHIFQISA
jgi:hypothetical protein